MTFKRHIKPIKGAVRHTIRIWAKVDDMFCDQCNLAAGRTIWPRLMI